MNTHSDHIEFEKLANLTTGRLSAPEEGLAREHIIECDLCSLLYSRLEQLIRIMQEDTSEDAPARAISGAFRVYDEYLQVKKPRPEDRRSFVQRLKAVLRLDSAGLSPLYGTRSADTSAERQMLYTAGDIDFDIRIALGDDDNWLLSGQIFDSLAGGELELEGHENKTFKAALDQNFQFSFPPVPSGDYKLRLRSATIEVEIPEITLGF